MEERKINMNGKKEITLIGGAGYIGSVLCDYFLKKNFGVKCIDNLIYNNGQPLIHFISHQNFKFINSDLRNFEFIKKDIYKSDYVIILAGLVGDPITKQYPKLANEINLIGIKNLIKNLNNSYIEKVIFVSTCSNYGFINKNELANEEFELNPISLYSKAKVEIENYILSLKGKLSYCPTILRFATAFGLSHKMRFDLTVNEFAKCLYQKEELLVYDPDTWRPYCHVKDFARIIDLVLKKPVNDIEFEIFNAGGDRNNFTKRGIVELISKHIKKISIEFQDFGPDPRNYRVDFKKIKNKLGFQPKYTVEDGIIEILDALKKELFISFGDEKNRLGNFLIKDSLLK